MDPQRKDIIINEILYWKKTKLLPEHQCQYLLTLYSEGEGSLKTTKNTNVSMVLWLIFSQICFFLSVFILYFTDFVGGLQIGFGIFFVLLSGIIGYAKRNTAFEAALHVLISTMILFVTCLKISLHFWGGAYIWTIVILFLVMWLAIAFKWKQKMFYILTVFVLIMFGLLAVYAG